MFYIVQKKHIEALKNDAEKAMQMHAKSQSTNTVMIVLILIIVALLFCNQIKSKQY